MTVSAAQYFDNCKFDRSNDPAIPMSNRNARPACRIESAGEGFYQYFIALPILQLKGASLTFKVKRTTISTYDKQMGCDKATLKTVQCAMYRMGMQHGYTTEQGMPFTLLNPFINLLQFTRRYITENNKLWMKDQID